MAINPAVKYPAPATIITPDYPYGKANNESIPLALDGIPFDEGAINDELGFQQALLILAGVIPSGFSETINASQYLDSLAAIFQSRSVSYSSAGAAGAYVLSPLAGVAVPANLRDKMQFKFAAHITNTATATCTAANQPAKAVVLVGDIPLEGGEMVVGETQTVEYSLALDKYVLTSFSVQTTELPPKYIDGLQFNYIDVAAGISGFNIGAGLCRDINNSANISEAGGIGKRIDINWIEGGTIALPAGGKPASENFSITDTVYIFIIAKPDGTTDAGVSLDVTGQALLNDPTVIAAGYTKARRVFKNYMKGINEFYNVIHDVENDNAVMVVQVAGIAANGSGDITLPLPKSTMANFGWRAVNSNDGTDRWGWIGRMDQTAPSVGNSTAMMLARRGNNESSASPSARWNMYLNDDRQLRQNASNGEFQAVFVPIGWIDKRID